MLDFAMREISFEIDGTWYSITFRTASFGRVKDVSISCSDRDHGFFYPCCSANVKPQNTTAVQALGMFWGELWFDIRLTLRQLYRQVLLHRRQNQ